MKQIVDYFGNKVQGHFKKSDGSIVVINNDELNKSKISIESFQKLRDEIDTLKEQMQIILKKLNDN
jgi:hypothetical protein